MTKTIYIRPKPQPEGKRALVVPLYDGTLLPASGKRVVVDRHVRMLLKDGDVEQFEPQAPSAAQTTTEPDAAKKSARAKEQSE